MNHKETFPATSESLEKFSEGYFRYLYQLLTCLDLGELTRFVQVLEEARLDDRTILLAGNGGSAATASHMAADLAMDIRRKSNGQKAFRAVALTDNVPLLTAIGNDAGYENLFTDQLSIHYRPGDVLVAISASGNSPNIVAAARWVRARGGRVLGMTGFDGGELHGLCDTVIHVGTPIGEYGPVEDVHMILDHLISNWLISQCGSRTWAK